MSLQLAIYMHLYSAELVAATVTMAACTGGIIDQRNRTRLTDDPEDDRSCSGNPEEREGKEADCAILLGQAQLATWEHFFRGVGKGCGKRKNGISI